MDTKEIIELIKDSDLYAAARVMAAECPVRLTPLDHLRHHVHVTDGFGVLRCLSCASEVPDGFTFAPSQVRLLEAWGRMEAPQGERTPS